MQSPLKALTIAILIFCTGCVVLPPGTQQLSPGAEVTNTLHGETETPTTSPDTPTPDLRNTPTFSPTGTPILVQTPFIHDPCATSTLTDRGSIIIAFVAEWDGDSEIYTVHADGSELTQLTSNATDDVAPTWSPDGKKIAYISKSGSKPGQLYEMNSDGSSKVALTSELFAIDPLGWSPKGDYIAFAGIQEGANDFYALNLDNGSLINLTQNRGYVGLNNLTWSPDGKSLAFDVGLDPSGAIRGIVISKLDNPAGQKLLPQPTDGYSIDFLPQWHPTDNIILFVSRPPGSRSEQIYVMNLSDSTRNQLTNTDTEKAGALWSPNGEIIAYGAISSIIDSQGKSIIEDKMIFTLNKDGTNQRLVVEGKELQSDRFSWAPDSRHVAFVSSETDNPDLYDLYFTDTCDSGKYLIAKNIANYTPTWRP